MVEGLLAGSVRQGFQTLGKKLEGGWEGLSMAGSGDLNI